MSSVKEKYLEQRTKIDSFVKSASNYTKDGPLRKTRDYLVQKKELFYNDFKLIKENHEVLLANKDENQDYFKKNTFDTIEQGMPEIFPKTIFPEWSFFPKVQPEI